MMMKLILTTKTMMKLVTVTMVYQLLTVVE